MTGDDIATNLEFLWAAGLLDAPLMLPEAVTNGNDTSGNNDTLTISGAHWSFKVLAKDVLEKMDMFRRWLKPSSPDRLC